MRKMYRLVKNFSDYLDDVQPTDDNTRFELEEIKYFANYFCLGVKEILQDFIPIEWRETNRIKYKKEVKKLNRLMKYGNFVENRIAWCPEERKFYQKYVDSSFNEKRMEIYKLPDIYMSDNTTLGELKNDIELNIDDYSDGFFDNIEVDISSAKFTSRCNFQMNGKINNNPCVFFTFHRELYVAVKIAFPWIPRDEYEKRMEELINTYAEETLIWNEILHGNGKERNYVPPILHW